MSDDEDISKNISWRGKIVKNPAEFDFGSSALTRNRQNATGKEEELPPEMAAGPSAVKPSRHFTIDELKYVDFLQPKVVLSRALAQFLLTWSNDTLEPLFRPDSADIPNAINDYLVASIWAPLSTLGNRTTSFKVLLFRLFHRKNAQFDGTISHSRWTVPSVIFVSFEWRKCPQWRRMEI